MLGFVESSQERVPGVQLAASYQAVRMICYLPDNQRDMLRCNFVSAAQWITSLGDVRRL
jgi:hypothetical protein